MPAARAPAGDNDRRWWIYDRGRSGVALWVVGGLLLVATACGPDPEQERLRATSKGVYDPQTGVLRQITYDRNKNGRIDTWTRMDGARPVSSEIDT